MKIVNLYLDKENDYVFEYNDKYYGFASLNQSYSEQEKYGIAKDIVLNEDYYGYSTTQPLNLSLIAQIEVE